MTRTLQTLQGRYKDVTKTLQGRYQDVTQTLQRHYCQILNKCDQILTEDDQNDQTHVENIQERDFLKMKKSNAKNYTGFRVGGEWV